MEIFSMSRSPENKRKIRAKALQKVRENSACVFTSLFTEMFFPSFFCELLKIYLQPDFLSNIIHPTLQFLFSFYLVAL